MLKRISSSPVFFNSPPTSFTNNVLRIDRSHYFSSFESNAAGTFSRIPRNHFLVLSRFQLSNIEKKITRMTINTNSRAIVFRAPLLSHVFKNWRETNTYARRRRMPAVTLDIQKFYWRFRSKMPLCCCWRQSDDHVPSFKPIVNV